MYLDHRLIFELTSAFTTMWISLIPKELTFLFMENLAIHKIKRTNSSCSLDVHINKGCSYVYVMIID